MKKKQIFTMKKNHDQTLSNKHHKPWYGLSSHRGIIKSLIMLDYAWHEICIRSNPMEKKDHKHYMVHLARGTWSNLWLCLTWNLHSIKPYEKWTITMIKPYQALWKRVITMIKPYQPLWKRVITMIKPYQKAS
jgi:hypothetical protein